MIRRLLQHRAVLVAIVVAGSAIAVTMYGRRTAADEPISADVDVVVESGPHQMTPSPDTVAAGEVVIAIRSLAWDKPQDVLLVRTADPPAAVASEYTAGRLDPAAVVGSASVDPGGTTSLTVTLERGAYVLVSSLGPSVGLTVGDGAGARP
jgi:hypothetical protein